MVVAFCGHAQFSKTAEYEQKILSFLEEKVADRPAHFCLVGYGDFDSFAYDCCKKYKVNHPNVLLIFITPYMTLEYQQNHLRYQKKRYDEIIYPEIEDKPLKFAIVYRNKWMIEQADYVICGISHDWGGAYKTYQHAKRKNKPIFNVVGEEF